MLTIAAYGYITSSGKAAGIPGVNVKTLTRIPAINVVLKNSYKHVIVPMSLGCVCLQIIYLIIEIETLRECREVLPQT